MEAIEGWVDVPPQIESKKSEFETIRVPVITTRTVNTETNEKEGADGADHYIDGVWKTVQDNCPISNRESWSLEKVFIIEKYAKTITPFVGHVKLDWFLAMLATAIRTETIEQTKYPICVMFNLLKFDKVTDADRQVLNTFSCDLLSYFNDRLSMDKCPSDVPSEILDEPAPVVELEMEEPERLGSPCVCEIWHRIQRFFSKDKDL
jgi:hypothetical protein